MYQFGNRSEAKKYLGDFLKIAPLSHALWRSAEALSFARVKYKSPLLDLGCGWGEFSGVVFNKIEMGIDINQDELNRAVTGKQYKNVRWADARKLPFRARSYQTVISVSVLEHIEHSERVISEVYRVLSPGGLFIFSVPTISIRDGLLVPKICRWLGFKRVAEKYFELHCRAFKHVGLKPKSWWKDKLEKNGFEIVVEEGTISLTLLRLHELFLISALPSQLGKLLFGKRLMMLVGLRSKLLPKLFCRFVYTDKNSDLNIFFVAKKRH